MQTRRWIYAALGGLMALAAACGGRAPGPIEVTPLPTIEPTVRQLRVFEAAWTAVRDQYVREDYHGLDWAAVGDTYRGEIEAGLTDEEFADSMRALMATLPDSQAAYQTRAERLADETADRRTYHGIGAFIAFREAPEPHVVVLAVIEDSPAQAAGLEPHDSIYAIDGVPFSLEDAEAPAERIRGDPDSVVTLTVGTPGQPRREITIQRAQIRAADVLRGGFIRSAQVAYYRVPVAADAGLAASIAQNLAQIAAETPPRGVILDLRVARSGDGSWPLVDMLTLFGDGDMGEFYTRTSTNTLSVEGQNIAGSQTVPLVVLVGRDTEGTPEILAAALQSTRRAVIIGQSTPGSVEGFTEVPLPDGSRIFLATSSFRTHTAVDLAESGVTPDLSINADWDQFTNASDPLLETALAVITGQPGR